MYHEIYLLLMNILVTGGAGFIGSNYVHYLLTEKSDQVITLDSLTYAGSLDNLDTALDHPRHRFIEGDICDSELVSDIIEDVDAVVNFAAESHVDRSIDGSKPFVRSNIEGTQTLLDASATSDIDRFVQISTDEVYGHILDGKFSESDPLNPRNPYAATKAAADHLVNSYHVTHDLPVMITRSSNNFGPRQHSEKLIPKFIKHATNGEDLPLYGDGSNIREWLYVKDNCSAIDTVLRDGINGEVYNVGSDYRLSNLEVTYKILEMINASDDLITFVEDRAGHDQRYALNTSKIESLGWSPDWNFEEGLERTVEYYIDG